jgi:hypothetical protein
MSRKRSHPRDALALARYGVRLVQSPSRSRWGEEFGELKSERLLLLEIETQLLTHLRGEGGLTPKPKRPRCGAMCRTGLTCKASAVWDRQRNEPRNGRCRMHGGLSTGPRTPEGRARALSNLRQYRLLTAD